MLKLKFLLLAHSGVVSLLKKSLNSQASTDLSDNGFTINSLKSCQPKALRKLQIDKTDTMITLCFLETNSFKNVKLQVHLLSEPEP